MATAEGSDMSFETLEQTVNDIAERTRKLRDEQEQVLSHIGELMAERLLECYEEREHESLTFEVWLNGRFQYESWTVYVLFNQDEQLKKLTHLVDAIGFEKRRIAAQALNGRLKRDGYTRGINNLLNDIKAL